MRKVDEACERYFCRHLLVSVHIDYFIIISDPYALLSWIESNLLNHFPPGGDLGCFPVTEEATVTSFAHIHLLATRVTIFLGPISRGRLTGPSLVSTKISST